MGKSAGKEGTTTTTQIMVSPGWNYPSPATAAPILPLHQGATPVFPGNLHDYSDSESDDSSAEDGKSQQRNTCWIIVVVLVLILLAVCGSLCAVCACNRKLYCQSQRHMELEDTTPLSLNFPLTAKVEVAKLKLPPGHKDFGKFSAALQRQKFPVPGAHPPGTDPAITGEEFHSEELAIANDGRVYLSEDLLSTVNTKFHDCGQERVDCYVQFKQKETSHSDWSENFLGTSRKFSATLPVS